MKLLANLPLGGRAMIKLWKSLFFFGSITISPSAFGTVDSILPYSIAAKAIQTEGYCLETRTMLAEIGIPAAAQLAGTFHKAPTVRYSIGKPLEYTNVNVLAPEGDIAFTFLPEQFASTSVTYSIVLDFKNAAAHFGTTLAGRQQTIDLAKLSVIAINRNLQLVKGDLAYKLNLQLKNLPSQANLKGSQVFEKTQYPYTEGSPVLAQYLKELVNVDGECRQK